MTLTIIVIAFLSLLITSDGLTYEQERTVDEAITVVEQGGFGDRRHGVGGVGLRVPVDNKRQASVAFDVNAMQGKIHFAGRVEGPLEIALAEEGFAFRHGRSTPLDG